MSASPVYRAAAREQVLDIIDRLAQSERLLTTKELAAILALSPKTLYSYVERNLIPHFKIETNVRFRGREVGKWLLDCGFCADTRPLGPAPSCISLPGRARGRSRRARC